MADREPEVRSMRALGRRFLRFNVTFMLLAVVCAGYLFFNAGQRDGYFVLALVGLGVGVAGCLLIDRVLIREVVCPGCGKKLQRTKPPRGKVISIQYLCEDCNVVWDTDAPEDGREGRVEYSDPL